MSDPFFNVRAEPLSLADLIAVTGAEAAKGFDLSVRIYGAARLDEAEPGEFACLDDPCQLGHLEATHATACFVAPALAAKLPGTCLALVTAEPRSAFARAVAAFYPQASLPGSLFGTAGANPGASIHPDARLEPGVIVDPGVVIGPRAEVGSGSVIAANSVIGPDVRIGRDCSIGAQVTVAGALIGDRVTLHPGVRIGQDGFGFAIGPRGHLKVPQIGRAIIQDDVEIGANSTVDRGAICNTVIGEGAKIGGLVQIARDVVIGRHCLVAAQAGIGEGAQLGDFVIVGGLASLAAWVRIGAGAEVAAWSRVASDVRAGTRHGC